MPLPPAGPMPGPRAGAHGHRAAHEADVDEPSAAAGKSHFMGAPSTRRGGFNRRAGPHDVSSTSVWKSSAPFGLNGPDAECTGAPERNAATFAREVRASHPRPVVILLVRPRTTAAAIRYPVA